MAGLGVFVLHRDAAGKHVSGGKANYVLDLLFGQKIFNLQDSRLDAEYAESSKRTRAVFFTIVTASGAIRLNLPLLRCS